MLDLLGVSSSFRNEYCWDRLTVWDKTRACHQIWFSFISTAARYLAGTLVLQLNGVAILPLDWSKHWFYSIVEHEWPFRRRPRPLRGDFFYNGMPSCWDTGFASLRSGHLTSAFMLSSPLAPFNSCWPAGVIAVHCTYDGRCWSVKYLPKAVKWPEKKSQLPGG